MPEGSVGGPEAGRKLSCGCGAIVPPFAKSAKDGATQRRRGARPLKWRLLLICIRVCLQVLEEVFALIDTSTPGEQCQIIRRRAKAGVIHIICHHSAQERGAGGNQKRYPLDLLQIVIDPEISR